MNEKWNLLELRTYVMSMVLEEKEQRSLLDTISSIDKSISIFRYHLFTTRDAFKNIFEKNGFNQPEIFQNILGISQDDNYSFAKLISEAHFLSCIHTVRNIYDIFSQLINKTILNQAISTSKCDINKVYHHLPASLLKEAINNLLNSKWFLYVVAIVNIIKHRKLVPYNVRVSLTEDKLEPFIEGFEYKGLYYEGYWLTEVLEGLLDVKNRIVECGICLNKIVIN